MTRPLTEEERATLKGAAFGAVFLVSSAEPGAFAMLRESLAASDAFAGTTGLVRELLTTGALPRLPAGSPDEVSAAVLPALRRSVEILRSRDPDEVASYRSAVLRAAEEVARAHDGISPNETAVLASVREALDAAG
ncbi:hypothetical protein ABNF97_14145 [Plantactinospora sp. B6F1]|uniref:hypothetical protein n=1 Tax=Plantactinospora sp. B6F1 TaxID=3158971 RepID=UPI0032D98D93